MKVVRTADLRSRVDGVFHRRGGGWYMISGNQLVLVGPALTVDKSVTIFRNGTAAASPDGKLLAVPRTDALALYDDSGDRVATAALRPWPDSSSNAVTFSTDGGYLVAVCAGKTRGTAEVRKLDGIGGAPSIATSATATFPVTNDVHPTVWAHRRLCAYLVSVGAGQDGQWSWWISDDGTLAPTEITALRNRAVGGVTGDTDTALSVPWAYGEEIAWHDLPNGNIIRRLDPGPVVGDDDVVIHVVDLGDGGLLVITGEGHALRIDQREGQPVVTARIPATEARSVSGWAGATTVTADELLLWDHHGGIALARATGQAEDSTADA